ncbi:reverse transcriptase domain-containing protein [Tanacetum coccineum]
MAAISNVPKLVDKKGGSYSVVAPRLEAGKFDKWKKRMFCFLTGMKPYYIQCIKDGPFKPKTAEVISCETAKAIWTDLVHSFEGPSNTKKNRIIDLKLEYQTFRVKSSKSLSQTYTCYKTVLNELANDGVTLSKHEINTVDLADIYGRFVYEDNLISRRYSDTKKALISNPSYSPISTAFFSNNIVQDFQENSDDEADERTSEEYLRDLDIEFHKRALLANSKHFIKRKNNFSSQKASEDTECCKRGKKGIISRFLPNQYYYPERKLTMEEILDLGASISLMPYTMYEKLGLGEPKPTRMSLELVDRSIQYPRGIVENVLIKVDKFVLLIDFVILDMPENSRILIILGRPFLAIARAMIDVFNKKIRVRDEEILEDNHSDSFEGLGETTNQIKSEKSKQGNFNNHSAEKDTIQCIDYTDMAYSVEQKTDQTKIIKDGDICSASVNKINEKKPELKDLPSHLEYAYLHSNKTFPIILSSELSSKENKCLLRVLEKHKGAIAWKMSDIKGISLSFCTHKILMDDDFKPVIQPQRRLNAKVQDVVVPKKGGMTVVLNEDNELIPSRTVLLLQGFNIEIKDKKGAKNRAADHLSRLENPNTEILTENDITNEFLNEHLMMLKAKLNKVEPWICPDNIIRRCVARKEILEILAHCHSGPTGGHHSASIIRRKVNESGFFWPSIFKDAKDYVMKCDVCQRTGNISSRNEMPQNNIHVCEVFDIWGLDFMGPFPDSRANKCILVAVDYVSKWVKSQAFPTNNARVVVKLLRSLFTRFRVPKALISDRGTCFCNSQLEKALQKYGVHHRVSTAYHPQSNGQTKVTNRAIKRILERSIGNNPKDWLVYKKACHSPVEIKHKAYWALKQCNTHLTAAGKNQFMQLNELGELRDGAYENTRIYKERTKKCRDSRIHGDKNFKVEDKVLLFNSCLKMHLRKLKSRWYGPNIVKIVYPYGAVEITDKNGFSFKVNGQRLKKYYEGDFDKDDHEVLDLESDIT